MNPSALIGQIRLLTLLVKREANRTEAFLQEEARLEEAESLRCTAVPMDDVPYEELAGDIERGLMSDPNLAAHENI